MRDLLNILVSMVFSVLFTFCFNFIKVKKDNVLFFVKGDRFVLRFWKKRKEKEIDDAIRKMYFNNNRSSVESVGLLKAMGFTADQASILMKCFYGNASPDNLNVTDQQLNNAQQLLVNTLKAMLLEIDDTLLVSPTESFRKVLAFDVFRFLSGLSVMAGNQTEFQNYIVECYNTVFSSDGIVLTPTDIENCRVREGLDNIFVERDGAVWFSPSAPEKLDQFCRKIPYGLSLILSNYRKKDNYQKLYTTLASVYQCTLMTFGMLCEHYENLYKNFYVQLNNNLLFIYEIIPDEIVTKDFASYLKYVNTQMHKFCG